MAKQDVSSIERHVEKGVLAITFLVLVAALVLYGLRSPNTVTFENQALTPPEIDQKVLDAARALQQTLATAKTEPKEIPNPAPRFAALQDVLSAGNLSPTLLASVPIGPRVPQVGGRATVGEVELATLVTPPKPACKTGRSVVAFVPRELGGNEDKTEPERLSVNWVTVGTLFDRDAQIQLNTQAHHKYTDPHLIGLDLQRREQQPDGSWGDWVDVTPYTPFDLPSPPTIALSDGKVPDAQLRDALAYAEAVGHPFNQVDLMRPLLGQVRTGDPWLYPKFNGINAVALDQPFYDPEGANKEAIDRYGPQPDLDSKADDDHKKPPPPLDAIKRAIADAKKQLPGIAPDLEKLAALKESVAKAKQDLDQLTEIDPKVKTLVTKDIDALLDKIEQAIDNAKRTAGLAPKAGRSIAPIQSVWAHDVTREPGANAIEPGRTYQFRVRFRLFNRYAAFPDEMRNREDATKVALTSEWSPPSEPVEIAPDVRFFLTTAASDKRGARVDIFKWIDGAWVNQEAMVEPGKPIAIQARVPVPSLGGEPVRTTVDFVTGAVVIDIDSNPHFRARRPTKGDGVQIDENVKNTPVLVYRDSAGTLCERALEADRDELIRFREELKKAAKKEEKKPDKQTEPPKPSGRQPGGKGGGNQPPTGKGGGGGINP